MLNRARFVSPFGTQGLSRRAGVVYIMYQIVVFNCSPACFWRCVSAGRPTFNHYDETTPQRLFFYAT